MRKRHWHVSVPAMRVWLNEYANISVCMNALDEQDIVITVQDVPHELRKLVTYYIIRGIDVYFSKIYRSESRKHLIHLPYTVH